MNYDCLKSQEIFSHLSFFGKVDLEVRIREIEYIINFAKKHEIQLIPFCKNSLGEKELVSKLYKISSDAIKGIPNFYPVYGVIVWYKKRPDEIPDSPDLATSLLEVQSNKDSTYFYLTPTEYGFSVLDEFRAIRGLKPYREWAEEERKSENFLKNLD